MKGKFIVFEGGEFCGKTTMANMLYDNLKNSGYDVILTREPGGTKAGEDIRKILKSHNLKAFTKLYLNSPFSLSLKCNISCTNSLIFCITS